MPERSVIGPKFLFIKFGVLFYRSLCLAIFVHCPFHLQTLYHSFHNRIQMSSIFFTFPCHCISQQCCWPVWRTTSRGIHILKALVTTNRVFWNARLDNRRIDVRSLTLGDLFRNFSGNLLSRLSKQKTSKTKNWSGGVMLISKVSFGLFDKTLLSEPPLP